MSMENSHTQEDPFQRATSAAPLSPSPTRAYFPPPKPSFTPTLSATLTASLATLASKKAYINLPSIQKVIAIHNSSKQDEANAPDYDETIASIPVLDLLPPPPVYDIVNCSTSQTLLLVSSLINTILAVNDRLACPKITLFHSRAIPNISIEAYLSRILQYAPFQNEVLLIILLYFDRIGGGCKPTQVLTNTIPKALLRQASMLPETDTKPKLEDEDGTLQEKNTTGPESDMEEEEPIVDEIYTSSSESPVGSKLIINSFNIHRLLITSILVACKFSSDVFYPNVRYARVGGLPLSELNQLELEFLFLSQFELNTTESELQAYGNKLLMYHQRLNGTERAAFDSIGSPVKGEYPVISEKKRTSIDIRVQPSQSQPSLRDSIADQKQRPPSGGFVASGPYRDSKEIPADNDDDEVMSEKTNDPIGSPRDWQFSGPSTPVIQSEAPEKYVHQRSKKMNLDHMIWPTNEMDTKYSTSHFGAMVRDEDAARIEEEFNKASPPPEQSEPNPKRKLQRLSSGTLEATPAKRANTPGASVTSTEKPSAPSNKNILRPLFKKIASFAGRSEATPVPVQEAPQPALRSHPYLVRHRISPASSSTNLSSPENEEMTSPTTPVGHASPWHRNDYPHQQNQAPSFQIKPPPPYSGQGTLENQERASRSTSNPSRRRQHRSREPSLSSLASELTFEPTRPSLPPTHEESQSPTSESHPSMAPFVFPPRPQQPRNPQLYSTDDQALNTPPATPMTKKSRPSGEPHPHDLDTRPSVMGLSPTSNDDNGMEMQCDDDDDALVRRRPSETGGQDDEMEDAETSSLQRGTTANTDTNTSQGDSHQQQQGTAGRQWQPPRTSAPVVQPVQYPYPHPPYVASYYPPNIQLIQDTKGGYQAFATTSPPHHPNHPQQYHSQQHPMVAIPRGMVPLQPAAPQYHPQQQQQQQPQQQSTSQTRTRQFAPIRPRTPITMDDEQKGRAAPPAAETSNANGKKKKDSKVPPRQIPLRPLVPNVGTSAPSSASSSTVATAPPPYRPSFVAYPAPYAHTGGRPPPPMLMAVDYHGGPLSPGGHPVPPQFLAAAPPGAQGGPTRLFIPIIPVVYNKALQPTPSPKTPVAKPSGLAKIAPRLHRPS